MALFIVSERAHNHHIAWGVSYEFEDIIARTCDATLLDPEMMSLRRIHPKWDIVLGRFLPFKKLENFAFPNEKNTLLLIGMGPGTLAMLETLPEWRRRCDVVAAFILDMYQPGIDRLKTRRLRRITDQLDHLFISYEQSIPRAQEVCRAPVSLILQGADVLHNGTFGGERPIDVISYGRRDPAIHAALQKAFNYPLSPRIYFHSTFKFGFYPSVDDYRQDRALLFQILRRTKLSLNYRYTQTTAWNARGTCPLTARWFESLAAGCVLVGSKPTGPEAQREFDWQDAVIDFPGPAADPVRFINALLEDRSRLAAASRRNYHQALLRHDWRYRMRDMLTAMKQPIPTKLAGELGELQSKAQAIESA